MSHFSNLQIEIEIKLEIEPREEGEIKNGDEMEDAIEGGDDGVGGIMWLSFFDVSSC